MNLPHEKFDPATSRCENCLAFERYVHGNGEGCCRRHAPVPVVGLDEESFDGDGEGLRWAHLTPGEVTHWPPIDIDFDDWCLEWLPAKAVQP